MSGRDANPYVGPGPFSEEEAALFFGREGEARELLSLVMAYQVVLFYSPSGAGKTSLIHARLLSALRERQAHVHGVVRLGGRPTDGPPLKEITNIFLFNALLSLGGGEMRRDYRALDRLSLRELLSRLPRPDVPRRSYPLHVVVFDQFEELFTAFPERWRDQEGFFNGVGEALDADPLLRVLLVMREEHVAALDPYGAMLPGRMRHRFRLERLRERPAQLAIEGPLRYTRRSFKPGAADKLVHNLLQVPIKSANGTVINTPGEFVEPMQLQVVCQRLWKTLPEEVLEIDEGRIAQYGDVDTALTEYYEECLSEIAVREKPKVDVGRLRLWFDEEVITPDGTRGTVFMGANGKAGGLSREVVSVLVEQRLIRLELRGGAEWYELTHDRFITPILKANRRWRQSLDTGEVTSKELEQKAEAWNQANEHDSLLLRAAELKKVRSWKRSDNARQLGMSAVLNAYIQASEVAAQRKKTKELLRQNLLLIALVILAGGLAALTLYLWQRADVNRDRAERADRVAKGELAKQFAAEPGREYDALVLGLEAVRLLPPGDVPPGAEEGLEEAVRKIGNRRLLRECAGQPELMDFSADSRLALALCNNRLHVWDVETGVHRYKWPGDRSDLRLGRAAVWQQADFAAGGALVFAIVRLEQQGEIVSPESARAGSGDDRQQAVCVLDAQTGRPDALQSRLQGSKGVIISDDGAHVMAVDALYRVLYLTRGGGERVLFTQEQAKRLSRVELSRDGTRLVTWRKDDNSVELWDTEHMERPLSRLNAPGPNAGESDDLIDFSPDKSVGVLVHNSAGGARAVVWEQAGGRVIASFTSAVASPYHLAFSADSKAFVIAGSANTEVRDTRGALLASRPILERSGDYSFRGTDMPFAVSDKTGETHVFLRNLISGHEEPLPLTGYIRTVEIAPDRRRALVWGEDGGLQLYNLNEQPGVEELRLDGLRERACDKLRGQKEYAQVEPYCGALR